MYSPPWYDTSQCGQLRLPDLGRAAASGKEHALANGIKPNQKWQDDKFSVVLSVIDCQIDFVHPQGALAVPGAVEDTNRLNQFIYGNVGQISHIQASLDSHYLFQPFHPFNWMAGSKPTTRNSGGSYIEGDNPEPFTVISLQDVRDDVWRPNRRLKSMQIMLNKLENEKKKQLCVWPLHCILGTSGHAWDPSFAEAMVFHANARNCQYTATTKGMSQNSEHYGILQAEVEFPEDRLTHLNTQVLSIWENADRVYFAGQAKSHCCLETLNQVVAQFTSGGKNHLLNKMFVLEDCMSSVADITLPDGFVIEFDKAANERFEEMKKLGVKFVKSTDPIVCTEYITPVLVV